MISALRLMLLFLMVALAGQVLGVGALQVDIYDYDAAIKSNVEAEILSDRQKYTYDGTLILSNDIGIAKNFRAPNLQNRYFIAFIDDFIAAKSVAPNAAQLKNINRFQKKIPANAKGNIQTHGLPNNGVAVQATSPGRVPGSKAVYEKQINATGKTIQYTKTTYNPQGNIVHVKDKLNGGTFP